MKSLWRLIGNVTLCSLMLLSATTAKANDLILESFSYSILKNGVAVTDPQVGYITGADQVDLAVDLAVSWDCVPAAHPGLQLCTDPKPSFPIRIAIGNQTATATNWTPVFDGTMAAADVQYRNRILVPVGNIEPVLHLVIPLSSMPLINNQINSWIAQQYDANGGGGFRFRLTVDFGNTIVESNETNNKSVNTSSDLIPLSGNLNFGAVTTNLGQPTVVLNPLVAENSTLCGSSSGTPGALPNLELNAVTSWDPSPGNGWVSASGTVAGETDVTALCSQFTINAAGNGFDLTAFDPPPASCTNPVSSYAEGPLGGFQVGVSVNLCPDGPRPQSLTLPLPEGLTAHLPLLGKPLPRGYTFINFTNFTNPVETDFSLLSPSIAIGFLVSESLPLAFNINGGTGLTLSAAGLSGQYGSAMYLYDRAFDAADPRQLSRDGVRSNDSRYSMPVAATGALTITSTGLQVPQLDFAAYNGKTHYPKMGASWNTTSVSIVDGKFAAGQTLAGGTYSIAMSPDCPGCASNGAATAFSLTVLGETLASDGAMAASSALGADPAWGPSDSSIVPPRNIFSRGGDALMNATLYVPGNIITGTGAGASSAVPDMLMGMRHLGASAQPMAAYTLQSNASRKGNFYAAGLNLGPEKYVGANGSPEIGNGVDLAGTLTLIGFGGLSAPDYQPVVANIGTKYVVREAGITGVFNTATPPQPSVYGYPLNLTRFAFRTINNALDDYSWMDGSVDVPGHAANPQGRGGFTVGFNSLALECSGDVGDGTVLSNAGQKFDGWNTSIELQTAGFVTENQSLNVCQAQSRQLQIGNTVDLKALQKPLNITSLWGPDGNPVAGSTEVTGSTDHIFDQPVANGSEAMGFALAMDRGISMETPTGSVANGWFGINGEIGVPLWKTLKVGTRLGNSSTTAQAQTVVMDRNVMTGYMGQASSNLHAPMQSATAGIMADYQWGNSGLDFHLPVYFEAGRVAAGKRPEFLGITRSKNLLVLTTNAGVDLITPQETKLSFGASADFERLKSALLPNLNIDLSDPESVAAIDTAFGTTAVSTLVNGIRTPANVLNNEVGTRLDDVLEKALRQSLVGVPELANMTKSLGLVQAFPELIASDVSDALSRAASSITTPLSDSSPLIVGDPATKTFDYQMRALYLFGPTALINADPANPAGAMPPAPDYVLALEAAERRLDSVLSALSDAKVEVANVEEKVASQVASMTGGGTPSSGAIQLAINDINSLVSVLHTPAVFGAAACNTTDNEMYLRASQISDDMQSLKTALKAVDLIGFGSQMSSLVGIDASGYRSAQSTVDNLVSDISGRIDSAVTTLNAALMQCSTIGYSNALNGITLSSTTPKGLLIQITDKLTQLITEMGHVNTLLLDPAAGLIPVIRDKLDVAHGQVVAVKSYMHRMQLMFSDAEAGYPGGFEYSGLTAAAIQAQWDSDLLNLTGQAYHWSYTDHSFIQEMAGQLRLPIDSAIATAASTANAVVEPLVSLLPHPDVDELLSTIVDGVLNSVAGEKVRDTINLHIAELVVDLNSITLDVFDQANAVIRDIVMQMEDKATEALQMAKASVPGIPLKAASMDGYGVATGNELDRLHIGAEWTMQGDSDDSTSSYNAALDITSWNANNKDAGCTTGNGTGTIDAVISTTDLPIRIAGVGTTVDELYLGFTMSGASPQGVFGGISIDGDIDFEAFKVLDPAFAAGVGASEAYVGASALAKFNNMSMNVAFLVGKTCNNDVLKKLDAQAAEFLNLTNGFNGGYARGGASIPVLDTGCLLTVGVSADIGSWVLNSPFEIGGIVGGGGYGKVACIGSLRGQITTYGSVSGSGKMKFKGEGFGVAGAGFSCEPETWTTVARSRNDKGCGTGDVSFGATYDGGWSVTGANPTGPH